MVRVGNVAVVRATFSIVAASVVFAAGGVFAAKQISSLAPLPVGRVISPVGTHTNVGSYPSNLHVTPHGWLVVTTAGYRQRLTVIRSNTGEVSSVQEIGGRGKIGLYFGLSSVSDGDGDLLYASRGSEDKISEYRIDASGKISLVRDLDDKTGALPNNVTGVATDANSLYSVRSSTFQPDLVGAVAERDRATGAVKRTFKAGGFPFDVAIAGDYVLASSERDGIVTIFNRKTGATKSVRVGENPTVLKSEQDGTVLASVSDSDTLVRIDPATATIKQSILLRPAALRGLPGSTPFGITTIGQTAYVAMSDLNAIAVVDLKRGQLKGYVPTGWYPTGVAASRDGKSIYVASAKGIQSRNPNGKPVGTLGQYTLNILEGTVSRIPVENIDFYLAASTEQVLANNMARAGEIAKKDASFVKPKIDHVIYVVKENRTYDQVYGDMPRGNNDPSLTLFGRDVTPNQHALSERFVQLDNFFVCAEVSADGWQWSTAGMANEYTSRNSQYNYAGRGRQYDFEGTNNGVAVDRRGLKDVAEPGGGYFWDVAVKSGKSIRNYGMFLTFDGDADDKRDTKYEPDNKPARKGLWDRTDPNFRRYDLSYPDSNAWVDLGFPLGEKEKSKFGPNNEPSRFSAFRRDYLRMLKEDKVPHVMFLRMGRDHTSGSAAGLASPRAMVSDNDYAVGQLVELVSKNKQWGSTAIFVLEDDAQAGFDHVDAHRSTALVVSPYTKKGLDSRFYNTDSMLKTMARLIGVKPWNQYVATAPLMQVFDAKIVNPEPYTVIAPKMEIISEINGRGAYRAKDSERLISLTEEESIPDEHLNDILWGMMKGANTPRPQTPGSRWHR